MLIEVGVSFVVGILLIYTRYISGLIYLAGIERANFSAIGCSWFYGFCFLDVSLFSWFLG